MKAKKATAGKTGFHYETLIVEGQTLRVGRQVGAQAGQAHEHRHPPLQGEGRGGDGGKPENKLRQSGQDYPHPPPDLPLEGGGENPNGTHAIGAEPPPLLLFNGIGANAELLEPITAWMPGREVITFDIPGVGHSPLPQRPYRLGRIIELAAAVLDHYGHRRVDVLGISWGGGPAQQFARSLPQRCRRLILCATSPGTLMVPNHPKVALKMATPRRYMSKDYARTVAGDLYGGDFRGNPGLAAEVHRHVRWQSRWGYVMQLWAMLGWTSLHWLRCLRQPTLIMMGADDPLVPLLNGRLMHLLMRRSQLHVFDCGHLFLLTRAEEAMRVINDFLDRPQAPAKIGRPFHWQRERQTITAQETAA